MQIKDLGDIKKRIADHAMIGLRFDTAVKVVPTVDTNIYASGDVLFDSTEVPGAVLFTGGSGILQSLRLLDKDDQTAAGVDLVFFDSFVSLGTVNAAPSISDANCAAVLGVVSFAAADFIDLGGAKVATLRNIGLLLKPASGTSIWVAAITRGTPTQTDGGLSLQLGIACH